MRDSVSPFQGWFQPPMIPRAFALCCAAPSALLSTDSLSIQLLHATSIPSRKFVIYLDGSRRRRQRWACSEFSRYSVVGPPCRSRRSLTDIHNEFPGRDAKGRPFPVSRRNTGISRKELACRLNEIRTGSTLQTALLPEAD